VAFADNDPHPRTITVSGEAREEVAPDQAILTVSLVSRDKDLKTAKQHNDAMADHLVMIAKQYNIPKEKIAISSVNISPEYVYDNNQGVNRQVFSDYMVSRTLRVTIDDLNKEEPVLSAIVDAKIDQINDMEFQLSDKEKYASDLRVKAFANAKVKAEALAQAAGGKLGQAITISTGNVMAVGPRPMPMAKGVMAASAIESVAPSLPGLLSLQENVQVTFGLE